MDILALLFALPMIVGVVTLAVGFVRGCVRTIQTAMAEDIYNRTAAARSLALAGERFGDRAQLETANKTLDTLNDRHDEIFDRERAAGIAWAFGSLFSAIGDAGKAVRDFFGRLGPETRRQINLPEAGLVAAFVESALIEPLLLFVDPNPIRIGLLVLGLAFVEWIGHRERRERNAIPVPA